MTRELDARMAEALGFRRVSAWRWCEPEDGDVWYWRIVDPEMMRILTEREEWRPYQDGDTREVGDTWCVNVKHYSTDIAAAWEVVEWLHQHDRAIWLTTSPNGEAWVEIWEEDTSPRELPPGWIEITEDKSKLHHMKLVAGGDAFAPTAPEAICLAFLKAVGGVPGE